MTRRTPAQYDWTKLEFDEKRLTKHFTKQTSKTVKYVVVHHMTIVGDGKGKALDAAYNVWQTRKASAHYGIDGKLVRQFVWDKDYAWATGSKDGNRYGISIEHANSTAAPKWLVSDDTWRTGARLAAHLHKAYKMGRPVKDKTLRKHSSFVSTACPGPYLGGASATGGIWSKYVAEAQRIYDEITATKPPTKTTTITGLHWNIAGSQAGKYGAVNATRGPAVGRYAKKVDFDVFLTCEASQDNLRNGVSSVLGKPWYTAAKAIWTADWVKLIASRKSYADSLWAYLKTTKYGAAVFAEKNGKKYSVLEIHTDYRKPAKQAKQVQSIFRKFRADSDKLGIPHANQFVVGDFNWDGTSGDNPFNALVDWNFIEHGSRTKATFTNSNGSKHLDGVLAHKEAHVDVEVLSRAELSDHNPVRFVAELR